jgi:hypothetical protein
MPVETAHYRSRFLCHSAIEMKTVVSPKRRAVCMRFGYFSRVNIAQPRLVLSDRGIGFMILTHIEYNIAHVLDSDDAVAICETEGAALKNLALLVCEAGWGLIVVETASDDHLVLARADGMHESNLFADASRWSREHGYKFRLKRSFERISSPRENTFVVAGDRTVEILSTYTALRTARRWNV